MAARRPRSSAAVGGSAPARSHVIAAATVARSSARASEAAGGLRTSRPRSRQSCTQPSSAAVKASIAPVTSTTGAGLGGDRYSTDPGPWMTIVPLADAMNTWATPRASHCSATACGERPGYSQPTSPTLATTTSASRADRSSRMRHWPGVFTASR